MPYILDGQTIRRPLGIKEANSTQVAVQRTLKGSYGRDYFGESKRAWELNFQNANKSDYDTINAIYQDYLSNGVAKTWQVTETNYLIPETLVMIDFPDRDFSVRGSSYLSDFVLTLTEV